jgi:hypothetical protein
MSRFRRFGVALLSAGVLGLVPVVAAAAGTDTVAGVEINANPATFIGSATGSFPGQWKAVILHGELSSTTPAAIYGGSFCLGTLSLSWTGITCSGSVASGSLDNGGTITFTGASSSDACPAQTYYAISDTLTITAGVTGSARGEVRATLTHYNANVWGTCITFAASVEGTVTFS